MIGRFLPRSGSLTALLLLALVLPMSGCGGCGNSDSDQQTADAKKAEQKKKDDKKQKNEKPKPDFEISALRVAPADPEKPVPAAKPGHWLSASRKMVANNFDFVGSLEADVAENTDGRLTPLELERQPFVLSATRGVVLPKGLPKYTDETLFIPRTEHRPSISDRLDSRDGTPVVEPGAEPLNRMPAYQYYFVILAREPARYKQLARMDALVGPSPDGLSSYYLVNAPRVDKYVPLPSNPLTWTSTAYVLWDDVDPSLLSLQQQQAMLDWLHWGGQLIVSGPDTLTLLRNSFLDPFLPATGGKSRVLTAESLAPLAAALQPAGGKTEIPPLRPARPWNGVALELRPAARWLPGGQSDLIAEIAVGRGRIVVAAFHLDERELIRWEGFDSLLNCCLLRHPARKFVSDPDNLERTYVPVWADSGNGKFDPRLTCGLRYLSRDLTADGTFGDDTAASPAESQANNGSQPSDSAAASNTSADERDDSIDLNDVTSTGSGMAGWNDFSGISSAARESLRSAAGIEIPRSNFIAWMLAGYLAVLGPLNWGFFRLLGRIEWAWVAAPLIAIVGAVVVTKAAHLNVGFARSQTEIDVVELQPNYSRAHLTRYTALYTSLSTSYDIALDDPHALVEPFAVGGESQSRQSPRTVSLHRDADVRLTDFDVSSNSTAMLHSEQMIDFGGAIVCQRDGSELRIVNRSKHSLGQCGAVWREPDGDLSAAWIGELPSGASRLLDFQPVAARSPALPKLDRPPESDDATLARLKVSAIIDCMQRPAGFRRGDMRLIGLLADPLPGMEVAPASSQTTRSGVIVVANLRYAPLPPPQPDAKLPAPRNAP